MCDSGRLWYLTSDAAIREGYGVTQSKLEPTVYFRKPRGRDVLTNTQVDNYVFCGIEDEVKSFERLLKQTFRIGEHEQNSFAVYGRQIVQDDLGGA